MKKAVNKYRTLPIQVKAAFWFLICSFLQKGISMITTPIFTRLLTLEEYGRYSVFVSWYGILSVFVTLSLCYGVFSQGIVKFEEDRDRFVSSLQGITVLMTVFWTVIYLLFQDFWNQWFSLSTVQMLALLLMCWTGSAFWFWVIEQRTLYKYQKLVVLTIFVSITKPLLGCILVMHATDKVTARILGLAAVELVAGLYCFVKHMMKGKVFINLKYWKYVLLFSIPLIPHFLSQTVLNNSDRIMIERMVNADKAAIYSVGCSISMIMMLFNSALGQTISPWMFKKIKDKRPQEIASVAYGSLAFIALLNIILIALAPELVRIFAPSEYYETIWAIPPLAMSCYFLFMYDYFARLEFYYEKTVGIMLASILGAALNVILNYFCIPIWGYVAAAYTTLVCYIFYDICHYALMARICRKNGIGKIYNNGILIGLSVAFVATGFMVMVTYNVAWLRYLILSIISVFFAVNYRRIFSLVEKYMKMNKERDR